MKKILEKIAAEMATLEEAFGFTAVTVSADVEMKNYMTVVMYGKYAAFRELYEEFSEGV